MIRGEQAEAVDTGSGDDNTVRWVAEDFDQGCDFAGDLRRERQNLDDGVQFNFIEHLLNMSRSATIAGSNQKRHFKQRDGAQGDRLLSPHRFTQQSRLFARKLAWVAKPMKDDMCVE